MLWVFPPALPLTHDTGFSCQHDYTHVQSCRFILVRMYLPWLLFMFRGRYWQGHCMHS